MSKDAATLDAKADSDLCRWSYTTGLPEVGNGGELIPLPESATGHIAEHVAEPADMLAHSASTQRMELAAETDTLALGLDAANAIKARDSIAIDLTQQQSDSNVGPAPLATRFMAKAGHQLSQVDTWNPKAWAAHSVEAARLAQATGKLMGAFDDAVLTVQRPAERGKAGCPGHPVAVGAGARQS